MPHHFLASDREQDFLLPPSLRDWLPEGHLAWFLIDAVGECDLSDIYSHYRDDGWGAAAYEPAVMVTMLLYAYCVGQRSSRRIEQRCREDVAFRVITANQAPDHATIARFRQTHEVALGALFVDVLRLCAEAGLVKVGVVAVDGTKMAADAAYSAVRTPDRLEAEVQAILAEAAAADAREDAHLGDARGDELPPGLSERNARLARLRTAKQRLEREAAEGHTGRGRPQANVTDPDCRTMKTQDGYVQGYNAQLAVTADQVIVAAELTQAAADVNQLEPMITTASTNLADAGAPEMVTVVADAGYWSTVNAELALGPEVLIAVGRAKDPGPSPLEEIDYDAWIDERCRVLARVMAKELTQPVAARELGLSLGYVNALVQAYRAEGRAGIARSRPPNGAPRRLPPKTRAKQLMNDRLGTERGRAAFRVRSTSVEPVFGQIKANRGANRFSRRGLAACASEWKLLAITHNLLKLWRATSLLAMAV